MFEDAPSKLADPNPALAALPALFYEAIGEEGVDPLDGGGTLRIQIPSRRRIGDGYRLALSPGIEIANELECPTKLDTREKWGPRLFLDQRSAPLASFAAIVLGRKDLVPCTHLLSINCRFLRISTRNSRLIAIASAV